MPYEMLVAMNVVDAKKYRLYREAIRPLLEEYQGGFRYDFEVSRTLSEDPSHNVTRLFAIYFGSEELSDAFFKDERYLEAKGRHYEEAVREYTVVASYDR